MGPRQGAGEPTQHGVGFPDAVGVFEDPAALTSEDSHLGEDRYTTLGADLLGRLVVVSWTWRGDDIRPISARLATPRERRQYQEG